MLLQEANQQGIADLYEELNSKISEQDFSFRDPELASAPYRCRPPDAENSKQNILGMPNFVYRLAWAKRAAVIDNSLKHAQLRSFL